jgi:hypothetical protein
MATVQTATYRQNPPLAATATLGLLFGTSFTYTPARQRETATVIPSIPLCARLDSRNGIAGSRSDQRGRGDDFNNPYAHNWFLGVQRELRQLADQLHWLGRSSPGEHFEHQSIQR